MDATTAAEPRPDRIRVETADGVGEIAYLDFGPKTRSIDAVFLHANGFNARTYRLILKPLAAEFRILAIDQRGHGGTSLPTNSEGRTSWYGLRDDLLAFLETLCLENVVLAGHSMGGTASLLAAAEQPGRVRGLALFDPVILSPESVAARGEGEVTHSPLVQGALRRRALFASRQAAFDAYRGRGAFRSWPDGMLADYVADGFKDREDGQVELACAPAWEASNFTSHAHDPWAAFAATTCPIGILRAAVGSTCSLDEARAATLAPGRISVQTIPDTTHFLPMERPDLVRQALREAIAR